MATITDYQDALDILVPGPHPITDVTLDDVKDQAIRMAVAHHGRKIPREIVEDVTADGAAEYVLADGLTAWDDNAGRVTGAEYPIATDGSGVLAQHEDWSVYMSPDGAVLRLASAPVSGEDFRVSYTAPHLLTAEDNTIPDAHTEAVHALCASIFCRLLAAKYAHSQDSTIGADAVQQDGKMDKLGKLAAQYRQQYDDFFSSAGGLAPACGTRDWDVPGQYGLDRLIHKGRYR